MAGLARCACGAGVANLDLVPVHPAVPDLVPCRFGVAPVSRAVLGSVNGVGAVSVGGVGMPAVHICAIKS
jgi:hypothetical protein